MQRRLVNPTRLAACGLLTLIALAGSGCDVRLPSGVFTCDEQHACPDGWSCDRGLCYATEQRISPARDPDGGVMRDAETAPAADGGDASPEQPEDAGTDAGTTSHPDSGAPEPSPDPAPDAGSSAVPSCSEGQMRPCYTGNELTRGHGQCKDGAQHCEHGEYAACLGSGNPTLETCNGIDDDCDGNADENTDLGCYPDATAGCAQVGSVWQCTGACRLGKQTCGEGTLSACQDAVVPSEERCTESGAAADENCDGSTDEGCNCHMGDQLLCYPGPSATLGVGVCRAGNLVCVDGKTGTCQGAIVPTAETCSNESADDDCDHSADNIPGRGQNCTVSSANGICASGTLGCQAGTLLCLTPVAQTEVCNGIDDDCDGTIDNGFNLNTDVANCGGCGNVCASGFGCCGGQCTAPRSCTDGSTQTCDECPPCFFTCRGRRLPCGEVCQTCPPKLPDCNIDIQ